MHSLYFLRVPFADFMRYFALALGFTAFFTSAPLVVLDLAVQQLPRVCQFPVRIEFLNFERTQQFHQFIKDFIFAASERIRQDFPRFMVYRVPQPRLIVFAANIAPHLVCFGFLHFYRIKPYLAWVAMCLQILPVYLVIELFFFFSLSITVLVLISSTSAVSRTPDPFIAISTIFLSVSR